MQHRDKDWTKAIQNDNYASQPSFTRYSIITANVLEGDTISLPTHCSAFFPICAFCYRFAFE